MLRDLKQMLVDCDLDLSDHDTLLQVITDCTTIFDKATAPRVIFHARRLCYVLQIERHKRLSIIPRRKRNKKGY